MGKQVKVLLVEDNDSDVFLCQNVFRKINPNGEFSICQDGEAAIDFLKNKSNNCQNLDLIILDINLPKISGLQVLQVIKQIPELSETCVAVYSSSNDPELIKSAFNAGAYYFMNKPIGIDEYLASFSGLYAACVGNKTW